MEMLSTPDRVVVIDTETTGLSGTARIVEIAAIEVDPRTGWVGRRFHHVVDPEVPIPTVVTRIHGIGDGHVRGKPHFAEIAEELSAFMRGATLAMHNASFDRRILDGELARSGRPPLEGLGVRIVDTLAVSRGLFPLVAGHGLDSICDRLRVNRALRTRHGALVDAHLLAQALPRLAAEYAVWCAKADDDNGAGVDRLECELRSLAEKITGASEAHTAEIADRVFGHIAAALTWIRRSEDGLMAQAATLVPADGWCGKRAVARWIASNGTSWKEAAEAYLSERDLDDFRAERSSSVLAAVAGDDSPAFLHGVERSLASSKLTDSIGAVTHALVLLHATHSMLEDVRGNLRDLLIQHARNGYNLRSATLIDRLYAAVDYRGAMRTLAPAADLEPFTTRWSRLSIKRRDLAPCAALFGPEPTQLAGSPASHKIAS